MVMREQYRAQVMGTFRAGAEDEFARHASIRDHMPARDDIDLNYTVGEDGCSVTVADSQGPVYAGSSTDPAQLLALVEEAGRQYVRKRADLTPRAGGPGCLVMLAILAAAFVAVL